MIVTSLVLQRSEIIMHWNEGEMTNEYEEEKKHQWVRSIHLY